MRCLCIEIGGFQVSIESDGFHFPLHIANVIFVTTVSFSCQHDPTQMSAQSKTLPGCFAHPFLWPLALLCHLPQMPPRSSKYLLRFGMTGPSWHPGPHDPVIAGLPFEGCVSLRGTGAPDSHDEAGDESTG